MMKMILFGMVHSAGASGASRKLKVAKRRSGLLANLMLLFLGVSVIPSILIGALSYWLSYNVLWENTVHSTTQLVEQITRSIDNMFNESANLLRIGEESSVEKFLTGDNNQYKNAKNILSMFEIYHNNMNFSDSINNIYIVGRNGKLISERYGITTGEENLSEVKLDDFFIYSKQTVVTTGNINPSRRYEGRRFIYIGIPLSVKPLRESYGAAILELKTSGLSDFCGSVDIAGTGFFTVFDGDGQMLYSKDSVANGNNTELFQRICQEPSNTFTTDIGGERTLVVFATVPKTTWKLTGQVRIQDLMRSATIIKQSLFPALGFLMICSAGLYLYFSGRLIYPLRKLRAVMQMATLGDMNARFESKVNNEISDVGTSFNLMIQKLDRMARQDLKRQANLQKAALDLLQAQINPHFLYNTLDTIVWQARASNTGIVIETVEALASFYRTTLSNGESWILVSDEIKTLQSYLFIQKARYHDIVTYHFDVETVLFSQIMLKLTLQPIVENAIYHGLKPMRGKGNVWIKGREDGDYMVFDVRDDGIGMERATLERLQGALSRSEATFRAQRNGGFGLENVNARIRLYYGSDCGLTLVSDPDKGTIVTVTLRKDAAHV
jgi:two-component system sensor histidine kinase YesM